MKGSRELPPNHVLLFEPSPGKITLNEPFTSKKLYSKTTRQETFPAAGRGTLAMEYKKRKVRLFSVPRHGRRRGSGLGERQSESEARTKARYRDCNSKNSRVTNTKGRGHTPRKFTRSRQMRKTQIRRGGHFGVKVVVNSPRLGAVKKRSSKGSNRGKRRDRSPITARFGNTEIYLSRKPPREKYAG